MRCGVCQAENSRIGPTCAQCGAELRWRCPECDSTSPSSSRFCGHCGARLATDGPAAAPPSRDRRAPSGAPRVSSAPNERRHLTVLFCDLVASTALARRLDPEELNDLTRNYYATCSDAIGRYEGVIANYMGDGVMALFGYPRAHEDDAERAVHAALAIVHAIQGAGAAGVGPLQVRCGIATGLVVVGEDGSHALTKEKTVVGEAPNLASHLQAAAEPNQVVISAATRRLVGDVFDLGQLALEGLKSASQGVLAWQVLGRKASISRFAARAGARTRFVGRHEEIDVLRQAWQQACSGAGRVVLLSGEAGIGKSRIVEQFSQGVDGAVSAPMQFQCSPHHVDSAFYSVIAWLQCASALRADDAPSAALDKLGTLLHRDGGLFDDRIALFASLLSIPPGAGMAPVEPDPQRRKERTLEVLVDLIEEQAAQRPALVIVEDMHWADPTTLELIGRVVQRIAQRRLLIVATTRPEFEPAWAGLAQVATQRPHRLGRLHCCAMVESIAQRKALPAEITDRIVGKTDGVPLFIEELTKMVLEAGMLRETDEAWVPVGAIQDFAIPATLQDSLLARLDRWPRAKEVAQVGAVIGREFSRELLSAVVQRQESDLQAALADLVESGLVVVSGEPARVVYTFKHALVQDAAYETLFKSRRQLLHGRIADVIEHRFADIARTQPELLAHHFTRAGLTDTALTWWELAGDQAVKRSANLEAVRHFRRAIGLLAQCEPQPEHPARELAMRIKLSGPLIAVGGYVTSELAENYARAWQLCQALGRGSDAFPIMYGQWVIPYVRGDMISALRNSREFLDRAQQQEESGLLMIGHRIYGSSLVWRGDTRAGSEHLQRALQLYRAPEHDRLAYVFSQHPRVAALSHLCLAQQHLGQLDQAMASGWEAIAEAKRVEHFNSIAYSLCFVSLLIMLRRDVATLKRTAGELLELAERHKASYWLLWARPMIGWIDAQEGRVESGIRQMHDSTAQLQTQSANLWVPQSLLLEAEVLGHAGDCARAYELLDSAQALIEPLDQRFYEAELHRVRGAVMLAENPDSSAGAACLDRAIEVARRQSSLFLELRASISKAKDLQRRNRPEDARVLVEPVLARLSEGGTTVDVLEARALLGELG